MGKSVLKKKALWQGLACVSAFMLATSVTAAVVLEKNKVSVNDFLKTTTEKIVSEDGEITHTAFTPSKSYLNADGTGNSQAFLDAAVALGRKEAQEGSVLLKNDNGALPIKKDGAKPRVTLLGLRGTIPLLGSGAGTKAVSTQCIKLDEALNGGTTNFTGIKNFDIDGVFEVNPVTLDAYVQYNETAKVGVSDGIAGNEDNVTTPYDNKEPSVAMLKEKRADFETSFTEYSDAAIVVVGRPTTENQDYRKGVDFGKNSGDMPNVVEGFGADQPLSLSANEKEIIKLAKEKFNKVIVLLNTSNPMEIAELKNDDGIDSILWVGMPGNFGMLGVADILSGKVNPSGGLYDIYAADNLSAPAMQNMGWYRFKNMSANAAGRPDWATEPEITRESQYSDSYLIEAEGIYVGYRYYETRYYDAIVNPSSGAKSSAGVKASKNNSWSYADEVTYGFGYGLSYTTFEYGISGAPKLEQKAHEMYLTFDVEVKNTGSVAGKTPVQVYGQAPYIKGGVEKSAIQLLAFEKSGIIEPGKSETVTVEVDLSNLASYDSAWDNGDGTKGTYIFDDGDYYFAVGNGAHDALNNILAKQGKNGSADMDYEGKTKAAYQWHYKYNGQGTVDYTTFGVSRNNQKIYNQLDEADWNNYDGASKVTYLSRSDWANTYPQEYARLVAPASMLDLLNGKYYEVKQGQDTSSVKWGQDSDLKIFNMTKAEWDDPRWEELLSHMSIEEGLVLAACAGDSIGGVDSIGFVERKVTENAGNGIDNVALGESKDPEAPWAIGKDDENAGMMGTCLATSPVVVSSFNPELMFEIGEFIGNQSLFLGIPILWGPGLNTHRTAYGGRAGEYYSEDPVLSGVAAMEFAVAARDCGLIVAPKHFAFNDQEIKRKGIAPFMQEQRAREIELRAYQIPVEAAKYDRERNEETGMIGLMTSFSKIGPVECHSSYGLMNGILQKEWGFTGYATTDIFDDPNMFSAMVHAGVTGVDFRGKSNIDMSIFEAGSIYNGIPKKQIDGTQITKDLYNGDAEMMQALRNSNKRTLWVLANSNLINSYSATSHKVFVMNWWRQTYIALITVTGVLTVGAAVTYVISVIKGSKKEEE